MAEIIPFPKNIELIADAVLCPWCGDLGWDFDGNDEPVPCACPAGQAVADQGEAPPDAG